MSGLLGRVTEGRKLVTVLFCDLVAYTQLAEQLDPEALRLVMSRFFDRAAAVVDQHGGTVEKFVGDEVMAVFGVPVVHEDDALRAVRAAVAIRDCVEELDRESHAHLEVRIGVNTGEVVAGDPSSGYGFVSGDAVAVGKRLEQAAGPGEILLGEATHALVAHAVEATHLNPLTLKGKSGEVTAYRLGSVDPEAIAIPRRADTPFAGHLEELRRLRAVYAEVVAGGGARLVTIVGEPGIGKSRLARELIAVIEPEARVLVGRCPPYGEGTTFSPVREVFRAAGAEDSELDGSSFEAFAATRRMLEELAGQGPVVAAFDDIHWAEETMLDLLEHLAARLATAPVLLLCLARPELAERRPQWLQTSATAVLLDALTESDSLELIDALGVPASVGRRICEMAEGNPLFMEQLAAVAKEDDSVVGMAGSIRGVLEARLDRLGREERAVLERASVVGRSFSLMAVLELIQPQERELAQTRLFDLARKGLIRPDTSDPQVAFRFQHALIRDVVYESMPKALRADLHEAVAASLDSTSNADTLAGFHLEHAFLLRRELGLADPELGGRAGRTLRRAAQAASSRTDAPATVALLERARGVLSPDDPELPLILIALGSALVNAGDVPGAGTALEQAIDSAVALGDRGTELHAKIELQFVRAFSGSGAPVDESVRLAREAIPELEDLGDELALARAWWLRSTGDVAACRWRERAEAIERALEHARRAEAGIEVVGTLSGLLAQALLHGPTPVDRAIARVQTLPAEFGLDRTQSGPVDSSLAGLLAMQGRIEEALRLYHDAAATYEEFGLRFRRAAQAFVGAQIELLAGNPEGAERELRASTGAFGEIGATTSATTHRAMLADVLCTLGKFAEAEATARSVGAEAAAEDLVAQVLWRGALARALAHRGSPDAAEPAAQSLALSAGVEFPFLRVAALKAGAEVELAAGRTDAAARLLNEASSIMEAKGNVVEVASIGTLAHSLA
jgi:class 3 adenylate cyclase/tetratricopeptide (TPR) repeat protein